LPGGRKVGATQSTVLPNGKVFLSNQEEQQVPQKKTAYVEKLVKLAFTNISTGKGENVR